MLGPGMIAVTIEIRPEAYALLDIMSTMNGQTVEQYLAVQVGAFADDVARLPEFGQQLQRLSA